jgi:PBS lyase HEAT-like repeat
MSTPAQLLEDLAGAGVHVRDPWELVNGDVQYRAAIPVLVDWLEHLDERVPTADRDRVREGLVRALTVPAARPSAAPVLLGEFRRVSDPTGLGARWVIGNALEVVADDSVFDEVAAIVRDPAFGRARQMVVLGLARSKDRRAVPLLIELLDHEDVAAQAAMALGKLRAVEARSALERQLESPQPLVRREARKALAKLG